MSAPTAVSEYAPMAQAYEAGGGYMIFIQAIASLVLRFGLAIPFWKSGLTRWDGFLQLRDQTVFFYEEIYKPTLFDYSIPYPDIAAWLGSFAEILLPAALVIGFATRVSALGLLVMTAVIFTIYPDTWRAETLPWAAMALALIAYGPGRISFDFLIWHSWKRR